MVFVVEGADSERCDALDLRLFAHEPRRKDELSERWADLAAELAAVDH